LALEQVHLVAEQQARILHRSLLLVSAVRAEAFAAPLMMAAVADVLADIITSARSIGAIVQQHASGQGLDPGDVIVSTVCYVKRSESAVAGVTCPVRGLV
jgi:hypothetical protein